ncbi:MAG: dephospho-CoA kinase [Simkaniaceae bacterium]|nr:dephospho-CoA kinase [Simkaniaceae bacterium]
MLKLKKIAITGGLSSGKSTVAKFLEDSGFFRIDSDKIVHNLLSTNKICIEKVVNIFGPKIINQNRINRKLVADIVFSDPKKLQLLENIIHPMLFSTIEQKIQEASKRNNYSLFAIEMPLVQEIGKETYFDAVLAVLSDESIAEKRYIALGHKQSEYTRRMKRHWNPEKKANHADFVIRNNGSLSELEENTRKFYMQIKHN